MVQVEKYIPAHKAAWDAFVHRSKNGTFLLQRDYMEYHADRFTDHSLLFYRKGKLIALLPANEAGKEIQSHGGLTYGGIISDNRMKVSIMLEVFEVMLQYFKQCGFDKINYKTVPHIYHQAPAEEDLYVLFRNKGRLYRRDVTSAIDMAQLFGYSRKRKWEVSKAKRNNIKVELSLDFAGFMRIEQELLKERYDIPPVHTVEEITCLANLFPNQVKLCAAFEESLMLGGIIIYETPAVAHCQYIAYTARGKELGVLNVIIDYLLTKVYQDKKYFDFGISTEQQGAYLNEGLISNKESYGARAVVHDFYEIVL
ncbi:GNAT family N-acetyltransferase [Pontibacter silvestris]|uniref:GNAT family N-acetyltransferase n=1 Tax=Pontibacter silvestris TaxID=2305183 RepID=A0ABW4WXH3_9BACT|nr:GNAT family N-acetyltransferase [Pontibacter silvestris]MCC9136620.1 GNAT family N-acetyltransferase [Pontibacter silvestris]